MGLYLDKIPSVALKAQSDGKAPPKTDIFALMTFFLESISYTRETTVSILPT